MHLSVLFSIEDFLSNSDSKILLMLVGKIRDKVSSVIAVLYKFPKSVITIFFNNSEFVNTFPYLSVKSYVSNTTSLTLFFVMLNILINGKTLFFNLNLSDILLNSCKTLLFSINVLL